MSETKYINPLSNADQSHLIIIDVQDKLVPTIAPQVINSVIKNINAIQEMALILKIPALISEQYPKGLGHTNSKILDKYNDDTSILDKTSFSCCQADGFSDAIQLQQQIIIVGMESHICVLQTALQLLSLNKKIFVIEDAICSRSKLHHRNALARMSQQGIIISNTESLIFEWLSDSKHPHFKQASKLIR